MYMNPLPLNVRVQRWVRPRLDRIIGIPAVTVSSLAIFEEKYEHPVWWVCLVTSLVYTSGQWLGNLAIFNRLRRRYPTVELTGYRVFYSTLGCLLYTVGFCWAFATFNDWLIFRRPFQAIPEGGGFGISLMFTVMVLAIYESSYFFHKWKKSTLETERLKRENIQSQYEMLKNQVNPHFLFNSLNTLLTIIPEDPELAMQFTQKLSDVYRYVLRHKDKELVPLRTELEFAEAFLFMMKIRVGECFTVQWSIPESYLHLHVAPLCLQMLLENAFKHNVASAEKPLHLEIYAEKGSALIVKNNLQRKYNLQSASTKVGLQNIITRYTYLTDQPVEVIPTLGSFLVSLPLLEAPEEQAAEEKAKTPEEVAVLA